MIIQYDEMEYPHVNWTLGSDPYNNQSNNQQYTIMGQKYCC